MFRQIVRNCQTVKRVGNFRFFSAAVADPRPQFLIGEDNGFLPRKVSLPTKIEYPAKTTTLTMLIRIL